MTAILFGSISSLVDTSELQREAFNKAFQQHGLDWTWDRETYTSMLGSNGGAARIAQYAQQQGTEVDAKAVHATKSELFRQDLRAQKPAARPGVVETIQGAKADGLKLGLVTTTTPENVDALLEVLDLTRGDFDVVTDLDVVPTSKPDAAVYTYAVQQLGEQPSACVAIEDNVGGVQSAEAAGVQVVAFPNENTSGSDFGSATTVQSIDLAQLEKMAA